MKNFTDLVVGDSVYLIVIKDSELPMGNIIKELTVKEIEKRSGDFHLRITLSDNTVITPGCLFDFHTPHSSKSDDNIETLDSEIYATSKETCIKIAGNVVKIRLKMLVKLIMGYKEQADKLGDAAYDLLLMKENLPVEVMAEAVIV